MHVNKLIKTFGFMTALSGAMLANSMITKHCKESSNPIIKEQFIKNRDLDNSFTNSSELWAALTGLSIIGFAGAYAKIKTNQINIPYEDVHSTIDTLYKTLYENNHNSEEIIKIIDNLKSQFNILFIEHPNGDICSKQQFLFTLDAIRHAAERNKKPGKDINIKLKYLFDKSVTTKNKFAHIDKKYRQEYPNINFDRNYGIIQIIKKIEYKNIQEPLVYNKMSKENILPELEKIEKVIYSNRFIAYYKHDQEDLVEKIKIVKDFLKADIPLPSNILNEINELYRLKQIHKTIQI